MSVRTAADERRDATIENINDAIENLAAIIIGRVAGWNDYTEGYLHVLQSTLNDLLNIRTGLTP